VREFCFGYCALMSSKD